LPKLAGKQAAIDGKNLRGSRGEKGMVHMISAFAIQASGIWYLFTFHKTY
jgi:hypothetical protein